MGGRRQTAAGELAQEGLNPAVVRPPEDAQRQAQRERAAPQSRVGDAPPTAGKPQA